MYDCLLRFAEAGSNPVREVIPADGRVLEHRHYPAPWLDFGGAPLRAYYHCHPSAAKIAGEHGHFHLFIAAAPECWTHLAALSMDYEGQPQALFSTNRWVTDEHWLEGRSLMATPFPDVPSDGLGLAESWLYGMLNLLRPRLNELWLQRDQFLRERVPADRQQEILENREYYLLSQLPVNLSLELSAVLSPQ